MERVRPGPLCRERHRPQVCPQALARVEQPSQGQGNPSPYGEFRDLTLASEPGQKVAIFGRSGAGKSTPARLIAGLYTPQSGVVRIGLADDEKLPVYCFVDCDPYGIANIYRTLEVGSGIAAHINRFFCAPQASYLGVTPQDIADFQLTDATHPLQAVDVKRAKDALENDPFFRAHRPWVKAIEQLLKMGVRAEQQALAKWGLNFVIEENLPKKLADPARFLP